MAKRFLTLGLAATVAAMMLAGFGGSGAAGAQSATPAATMAAPTNIKIGLVTDVGHVDDGSFNQSTWEGTQAAAKALNLPAEYIETNDPSDYGTNINALLNKGDNVIITVGFNLAADTVKAAQSNPDVLFIGIDQDQSGGPTLPNLVGIVFHEDEAGFLVGVLAARLSKSGKVAGVYGFSVPAVVRYKVGFENGAKYANSKISVISTYYPGDISKAFTDPTWGATTAGQAIDQGADVVFAAAGQTGNGALSEAAKRTTKDKPLICIGVDTDQWLTVPEAHPCLVSSAEKLIPPAIAAVLKQAVAGSVQGGNFFGTVGVAPFHDFDSTIPQAVKDELTKLAADLASGKVTTGYSEATPAPTMAATAAG